MKGNAEEIEESQSEHQDPPAGQRRRGGPKKGPRPQPLHDARRIDKYIKDLYPGTELDKEDFMAHSGLDHYGMLVDEDVARMLGIIVKIARPVKILEIGTSIGYSAACLARACAGYGGKVLTIEIDEDVAADATKNFERLGLSDTIELRVGDAKEIVPSLEGPFDLVFQDVGEKTLYDDLFDDCVRLLPPGGLLVMEDALFPAMHGGLLLLEDALFPAMHSGLEGDGPGNTMHPELDHRRAENAAIDRVNHRIATSPAFESTLLPLGDGLVVAIRLETNEQE
jgi:predicted O-methyltransferase YrrM